MRSLSILLMLCIMACTAVAQQQDTTHLKEVVVYGLPVTPYATGSKVRQADVGDRVASLADGLGSEASLYLKAYGNGQLATIGLRGTSASQTSVLWNGINVNSPTLGQTDVSLIPLFFFDVLSVHYGTASSFYGSDAIGGSIVMGHATPAFGKAAHAAFYQQVGSFGKTATGIKTSYGNERLQARTKLYHSYVRNDFPFTSPAVGRRKTQTYASVENYGIDQQVYYRIAGSQTLSAEVMYTDNLREIQGPVTNNQAEGTLGDEQWRVALNYNNESGWAAWHATAAYLYSDQEYIKDEKRNTITGQLVAQVNGDKVIGQRSHVRFGMNYSRYTAHAENFSDVQEARYDVFGSYRYAIAVPWTVNINVRQSFYDSRYAPFSPSLGTAVHLLQKPYNTVTARAIVSRGYRVPTLNDRYYRPGGNPSITPEDALHAEGGVLCSLKSNHIDVRADVTAYQSAVDDMIVWQPGEEGVWSPSNLQKVRIRGVEFSGSVTIRAGVVSISGGGAYSFTQSLNRESATPSMDNKQLAYVPRHLGNAFVSVATKTNWKLDINYAYTGLRYTNLDNSPYSALGAFNTIDASLSKKLVFKKWQAEVKGEVRNVTDIYYEYLAGRAMPGRNYAISLFIKF